MSFMDKLKFWKKSEDEFAIPKEPALPGGEKPGDLGLPELDNLKSDQLPGFEQEAAEPSFQPSQQQFRPQHYPQAQQPLTAYSQPQQQPSPQLELINSKLDAVKAMLSVLEQKLSNLERALGHEKKYW